MTVHFPELPKLRFSSDWLINLRAVPWLVECPGSIPYTLQVKNPHTLERRKRVLGKTSLMPVTEEAVVTGERSFPSLDKFLKRGGPKPVMLRAGPVFLEADLLCLTGGKTGQWASASILHHKSEPARNQQSAKAFAEAAAWIVFESLPEVNEVQIRVELTGRDAPNWVEESFFQKDIAGVASMLSTIAATIENEDEPSLSANDYCEACPLVKDCALVARNRLSESIRKAWERGIDV